MICWFDSELVWILDLYSATTCTFRPLRPVKGGRRCTKIYLVAQLLIFFKGEADESN
jgi:hypothetical protein